MVLNVASFFHYAMEALMVNEFRDQTFNFNPDNSCALSPITSVTRQHRLAMVVCRASNRCPPVRS